MTSSFKLCKNSTTYLAPYTETEIGSLSVRFYLKGALMNKQFPHQDQFYYFNSFYRNYRTVNFNSKFIGEKKKTHEFIDSRKCCTFSMQSCLKARLCNALIASIFSPVFPLFVMNMNSFMMKAWASFVLCNTLRSLWFTNIISILNFI